MIERIDISELKTGMFVSALIDKDNETSIKQCGIVRTEKQIEELKKKGIRHVMVEAEHKEPKDKIIINPMADVNVKSTPLPDTFKNFDHYKQLINETRGVQDKIIQRVRDKKTLDVAEIEGITGKLLNAIIENSEAMWFMTRIRKKNAYLTEHSANVGILLGLFAQHLGFEESLLHELVLGGFLHDIGKLMIPEKILNKPGKLTEEEHRIMKGHVVLSREIIETQFIDISPVSLVTISTHHEKVDGTGYPEGVSDEDIPFYGKMVTIVDVFDALTAERCYKKEMTNISALRVLMLESGKSFDPYLVTQFIKFIGTYPAGTMVEITGEGFDRLAIIESKNSDDPLKPVVKIFYNVKGQNYTKIEKIDLASANCPYEIKKSVTAGEFDIDMTGIVDRCF